MRERDSADIVTGKSASEATEDKETEGGGRSALKVHTASREGEARVDSSETDVSGPGDFEAGKLALVFGADEKDCSIQEERIVS